MDLKNSGAYLIANFLNFLTLTKFLYFGIVEADKIAKNKVGPIIWDTLFISDGTWNSWIH